MDDDEHVAEFGYATGRGLTSGSPASTTTLVVSKMSGGSSTHRSIETLRNAWEPWHYGLPLADNSGVRPLRIHGHAGGD